MSRSFLLLVALVFTLLVGCKKDSASTNAQTTKIDYQLVSPNTSVHFDITYNNSNSQPVTTHGAGGWTVSFNANKPYNASITAGVNTTTTFPFTVRILSNGTLVKEETGTTMAGATTSLTLRHTVN